jgi:hypothetical protein
MAMGRGRWILIGTSVVMLVVAGVLVYGALQQGSACQDDPSLFAGRWDSGRREALRTAFGSQADLDRSIVAFDQQRHSIETQLRATCLAEREGKLPAAEARERTACLKRLAAELGEAVTRQLATKAFANAALPRPSECASPQRR